MKKLKECLLFVCVNVWWSEDNFLEWSVSPNFIWVPETELRVPGRHFNLLCHLDSPQKPVVLEAFALEKISSIKNLHLHGLLVM